MSFQILPVEEPDLPDLARLFLTAFEDDPLVGRLKMELSERVRYEETLKYLNRLWAERYIYGARFLKAVEVDEEGNSGKIVAFARWQYPHHLTEEQLAAKKAALERKKEHPAGMNVAFYEEFYNQLKEGRKRWIDHEKTFFLQILATLPSYQRRGIGAQLLAPGLAAADEANAKTYIEATAIGLPLYLRHGWKPVGELRIDLDSFGYEGMGVRVQKLLIREPRGGREDGETEGEK